MLAVFVNPRSRACRKAPQLAAELEAMVGRTGRLLAPMTIEQLRAMAEEVRKASPSVLAVHGGDGTLHKVLTVLVQTWAGAPLPPIALLCGGTMNVVARSLGLRGEAHVLLPRLVAATAAGKPLATVRRRCMRVGDAFGFIFGNGLLTNFLEEYYASPGYGTPRALWLITRTLASAATAGEFSRRIFRRFRGSVRVDDGPPLPWTAFLGLGAGTVREIGLGFKLNHRADDDPDRFGVLAMHAAPMTLALDVAAVRAGRGIAPSRAYSAVASRLDIHPEEPEMKYTIDGDLYRVRGDLRIESGPEIEFVSFAGSGLIETTAEATMKAAP